MVDLLTHEPIKISTDGDAGPYIMVPQEQLSRVTELFRAHDISFWTDAYSISLNGTPAIAVINLGTRSDAARAQEVLDQAQ